MNLPPIGPHPPGAGGEKIERPSTPGRGSAPPPVRITALERRAKGARMPASPTLAAVCAAFLLPVVTPGAETFLAQAGSAASSPTAAGTDVLPFRAVEKRLPNGLKVIVVKTGFPNIVSLQIPVNSGSRNEIEAGKTGFAHFFEHMMFRGTRAYPPEKYQGILTRAGARQNAYTDQDFT